MSEPTDEPTEKPPVRVRIRMRKAAEPGDAPVLRLVANRDDEPRKKRKPNSGSMKKGETRNPNGRPKGAKGAKATVYKVLGKKTEVRTDGKKEKVSIFQLLLLKELQMALAGDNQARKTMLELGRWAMPEQLPGGENRSPEEQTATDEAILAWYTHEIRERDRQRKAGPTTKLTSGKAVPDPKARPNDAHHDGEGEQ